MRKISLLLLAAIALFCANPAFGQVKHEREKRFDQLFSFVTTFGVNVLDVRHVYDDTLTGITLSARNIDDTTANYPPLFIKKGDFSFFFHSDGKTMVCKNRNGLTYDVVSPNNEESGKIETILNNATASLNWY